MDEKGWKKQCSGGQAWLRTTFDWSSPSLLFFGNQNLRVEAILKQHVMKHQIYMSAWNLIDQWTNIKWLVLLQVYSKIATANQPNDDKNEYDDSLKYVKVPTPLLFQVLSKKDRILLMNGIEHLSSKLLFNFAVSSLPVHFLPWKEEKSSFSDIAQPSS